MKKTHFFVGVLFFLQGYSPHAGASDVRRFGKVKSINFEIGQVSNTRNVTVELNHLTREASVRYALRSFNGFFGQECRGEKIAGLYELAEHFFPQALRGKPLGPNSSDMYGTEQVEVSFPGWIHIPAINVTGSTDPFIKLVRSHARKIKCGIPSENVGDFIRWPRVERIQFSSLDTATGVHAHAGFDLSGDTAVRFFRFGPGGFKYFGDCQIPMTEPDTKKINWLRDHLPASRAIEIEKSAVPGTTRLSIHVQLAHSAFEFPVQGGEKGELTLNIAEDVRKMIVETFSRHCFDRR